MSAAAVFGLGAGDVVLVVAPHPDDETLGAGGTVARLTMAGADVHVLAVTCRTAPMWGGHSDPALRIKEFHAACDLLGVSGRHIAWVDDERGTHLEGHSRDLVELIESGSATSLEALNPQALLIPVADGFHHEHRAVHHAGLAAARLGGADKPTPRIVLGFCGPDECWTVDGTGRVHVDITHTWRLKEAALAAYGSQLRPAPHPRNIDAINIRDAATGLRAGVALAEAFVPYRMVC